MPGPGRERELQKSRRDFRSAHLLVEWFTDRDQDAVARLGDIRRMGRLPAESAVQSTQWQQGAGWIALVIAGSSEKAWGPLAAMAANAEMGLVETQLHERSQRRRFEAIASASEQMQQLVDDLLLLAKNGENRLGRAEPLDLSELLEQELDLQQDLFSQKQLKLVAEIAPGIRIYGYGPLLHRLVRNLLDNARRYTEPGGLVRVSAQRRGRLAHIAVLDSGIGLNPDQQARVFDRFWRARQDRSDGGSGLGLANAARICSLHGGRIQLNSEPGTGSCFEVDLPALPASVATIVNPA